MGTGFRPGRLTAAVSLLIGSAAATAADCNGNGTEDWLEITAGSLPDCNGNGVPDPCDILPVNFGLAARGAVHMGQTAISGVAAADLDGDGDLDLASADAALPSAAVAWNLGGGTFSPPTALRGESPLFGVAAGDIDRDGKADLVAATEGGFLFLVNVGARRFASRALEIAPASRPVRALALADLDGDDGFDIAAAAPFKVLVLLNPGDGSFSAQSSIPVGSNPMALATARIDGDADVDIVTANHLESDIESGNVSILLNDGSGAFGPARNFGTTSGPTSVAAGDLDGDGDADVAVACIIAGSICVLTGNGEGALAGGKDFPVEGFPASVTMADVDGDRDLDVASGVLGTFGPGTVSVLGNHGSATFAKAIDFPSGFQPGPVLAADLTGDGVPEIAAGLDVGTLLVLEHVAAAHDSDCDASGIPDACELPANDCNRNGFLDRCDIAAGESLDCNADGEPDECEHDCNANGAPDECDIASGASADCNQNGFPDECDIGPSAFRFDTTVVPSPGDDLVLQLQSGDLDRDGRVDVFGFQPPLGAAVFWNEGRGAFAPPDRPTPGLQVNTAGAGDFDGDDDLDLVVGDLSEARLLLFAQDGRSFRRAATIGPQGFPVAVAPGDIDRDGDLDLAAADGSLAALQFFSNDGSGRFTLLPNEMFSPVPHLLLLADIDGDGPIDLLIIRAETGLPAVFWGDADRFGPPTDLGGRETAIFAATPDMDGDGDLEVVAGVFDGFTIAIQEGRRSFRTAEVRTRFGLPFGFRAEDLDLDGDIDLAAPTFVDNGGPALATFRNLGEAGFGEPELTPAERFLGSITSGDYDGDGLADLAMAAQSFCFDGACAFDPSLVGFLNRTHAAGSLDADGNGRPDECDAAAAFRRGDSSGNGSLDVADAVFTLRSLFQGGPAAACAEAADSDNDGTLTLSDPVLVLEYLFRGGPPPAPPGAGECGLDPDPAGSPGALGCGSYDGC